MPKLTLSKKQFQDWMDDNNIRINIGKCDEWAQNKFYASSYRTYIVDGGILDSATGFGQTKEEATNNHIKQLQGKTLKVEGKYILSPNIK